MKQNKEILQSFLDAQNQQARAAVKADARALRYHLMPPAGWLNDPNGLYQKDGIYHVFYQYAPANAQGTGKKGWGHYSTKDFVTFQEEPVALIPDDQSDLGGAYSGSAYVDKDSDTVHFFYTGNNKLEGDYDYINDGRIHWTNHFTTKDGKEFTDKETLLKNADYPEELSCHVRDPKVYKDKDGYKMVLGSRTKDSIGRVDVFASDNLTDWKPVSVISSKEPFGYMWECPDLFDLDGEQFLITCPQGVEQQGIDFENLYQNGYFVTKGDLDHDQTVDGFTELDHGFDFYAPQTMEDENGRRILIGWMGMPDVPYTNPTDAWQHALTLPRELHAKNGHLYQYPIKETQALRISEEAVNLKPGIPFDLKSQVFELQLAVDPGKWVLTLRKDVTLTYEDKVLTLDMHTSGSGRDQRHVRIDEITKLSIFSDTSSLEIFINQGQEAFTTRVYDSPQDTVLLSSAPMSGELYQLGGYTILEPEA
jgi:beta-fructofuranosidase